MGKVIDNILKGFGVRKDFEDAFDCNGKKIEIGHVCQMKIKGNPNSKVGYYVIVQPLDDAYRGCKTGMQTFIPEHHSAALHSYWSVYLEIVGDEKSHGHLLSNQKI